MDEPIEEDKGTVTLVNVVTDENGNPTGNVYFDVASWPHYGELTHQKQTAVADAAFLHPYDRSGEMRSLRVPAGRYDVGP